MGLEKRDTMVSGQRQSNMELLRIVAMFCIVCFHCAYKSGIPITDFTANTFAVKSMWYLGELGVNLFMLVTGYFMVTGRFRGSRLILLVCQVLFYWLGTMVFGCLIGVYTLPTGIKAFIRLFFPTLLGSYWYVTAYVVIYVLSPWINRFVIAMSQKMLLAFILVMLFLYSVIPTLFGFLGAPVEGMLSYTRLVWLFIVYLTGAYLRLYPLRSFAKGSRVPWVVVGVSLGCMLGFTMLVGAFGSFFGELGIKEWAYFWPPNTVPMMALSIGVFALFSNLCIPPNRVINRTASATLGVYLFHDSILQGFIWKDAVGAAEFVDGPLLIPVMLFGVVCVYVAGTIIDLLRQLLESATIRPMLRSDWWQAFSVRLSGRISTALDRWIEAEHRMDSHSKQGSCEK